jgi:hypothetical protein
VEHIKYSEELISNSKAAKEHNDCTVKAWVNTFDCSYESAHAWLKKHGRINRRGMMGKDIHKALESCKKAKIKIGPYGRTERINLRAFCEKHNKGRYYILVRGHALSVRDGVVHDYYDGPRRYVTFAARVYLEGEI